VTDSATAGGSEPHGARSLTRVCVYCGSSAGSSPRYCEAAAELGRLLAARGVGLVYGGGRRGVMGALADAALAGGCKVTGVIPRFLYDHDLHHRDLSSLRVVETMHERKAAMVTLSDAFIALPGGIGTLEEVFEVWTWTQLGEQNKPVGLLDVEDFYRPLIAFVDHLVATQFLKPTHRAILQVAKRPEVLLGQLAGWVSQQGDKWAESIEA
jgi:uncharacterized protein (TIGR00730 family)